MKDLQIMRPEIAFFDIDGTLLDFGADRIRPTVVNALQKLQGGGCKLFLATGRAPFMVPAFQEISFDGVLCFNGSLCFDRKGIIFSNPLDQADLLTLINNAEQMGKPVILATERMRGYTFYDHCLDDYLQLAKIKCEQIDLQRMETDPVYQLTIPATGEYDTQLLQGTTQLKTARWWDKVVDVIPAHGGKALAMEHILLHYGIEKENSLAFGDGDNDLDMIRFAGVGIAMGNASNAVKEAADWVTNSCAEDGVYTALVALGLIE